MLVRQVFGPRLLLTPSGSLYRWLLPPLCADSLERVLAAWVQTTLVAQPDEAIALSLLRSLPAGAILPIILSKLLPSCFRRGASNNSQTLSEGMRELDTLKNHYYTSG